MTKGDVVDLSRGKSKVLWQIELRWNISKVETHAFYWASGRQGAAGLGQRERRAAEGGEVGELRRRSAAGEEAEEAAAARRRLGWLAAGSGMCT